MNSSPQGEASVESRGGSMLSELPVEMIFDVFMKLPTETLCVCSAVCKSWYQIPKSPRFIKTYNTNIIQNSNFPIVTPPNEFLQEQEKSNFQVLDPREDTSLTFFNKLLHPPQFISKMYPCKGWVLFITKLKELYVQQEKPYFICNPSTGEHIVVPKSPVDAYKSVTGFGWDAVSESYKVIKISDDCTHKLYFGTNLEVYNVATGKWGLMKWTGFDEEPCRASSILRFGQRPNTFLKGRLHWISYPYDKPMNIISLRLDTEIFQQVPMPPGLDMDPIESRPHFRYRGHGIPSDTRIFQHYLLVLGGRLCLVHDVDDNHVEIWMMNIYELESSWEKKYIMRNISTSRGNLVKGPYRPITLNKDGEIFIACSDRNQGYYHPVTGVFRPLNTQKISQPPLHVGSFIYVKKRRR